MNALFGILLVSRDPETVQLVTSEADLRECSVVRGVHASIEEMVPMLDRVHPAAVLVDIDVEPDRTIAELEPVIAGHPDTRFVVLSSAQHSELILQAMQAGARHFMLKRDIVGELCTVLRRIVTGSAARKTKLGSIITVLSSSGGCGSTTLAINLADELKTMSGQPTLLIDLDQHHGSVAGYLGLQAEYGVADVLSDGNRIDGQLVRTTAVTFDNRLHVLASPATVNGDSSRRLVLDNLSRMLLACRETFAFTVIDAPRMPVESAATLARASSATFLPFQLNVENIRLVRVLHRALLDRNVPAESIYPIANRYRSRHEMISLDEARQAIGCAGLGHLSNDYKAALSSMNLGKTLSTAAPRSALRTEIKGFAERIRSEVQQASRKENQAE